MNIKVYSREIKRSEVEDLINLLPERYSKLDVKISVYGSRIHSFCTRLLTGRRKGKYTMADFDQHRNEIRIFPYEISKKHYGSYFKVVVFSLILHELRHKYQWVHFRDRCPSNDEYITHGEGYHKQWIEKDAHRFARRVTNLYREGINEVLKITGDQKDRVFSEVRIDDLGSLKE